MKLVLKNIAIFLILTVLIFFTFTTIKFINLCNEYQIKIFCSNGYNGIESNENIDEFKMRGLGAAILSISELVENNSNDKYDTNGYALWMQLQIAVFEITQYYLLSIFLGISITFGYNIILNKKFNKFLKIIIGYILPMITMPTLYYFIRSNRVFVEQNKLVEFCIIYTIIFALLYLKNHVKTKQ